MAHLSLEKITTTGYARMGSPTRRRGRAPDASGVRGPSPPSGSEAGHQNQLRCEPTEAIHWFRYAAQSVPWYDCSPTWKQR